jgi:hypothetical protein
MFCVSSATQANCRQAAGSTNGSLLKQWISKVVAAYSTKVSWPLISMKLDDQLAYAKVSLALLPFLVPVASAMGSPSPEEAGVADDICFLAPLHSLSPAVYVLTFSYLLLLQKRIKRDACSPKYTLQYDDGTKAVSQLTISSATGDCEAPFMVNGKVPVGGANTNVRVSAVPERMYETLCAGAVTC